MNITTSRKKASSRHRIIGTAIKVNGRIVGQVIADTYIKDIVSDWILRRPFLSIASDISALHDAERAGAEYVKITCIDTGIVYCASIAKFLSLGKKINFGWGEQLALGLEHFEKHDQNTSHTNAPIYAEPNDTHTESKRTPKQLELFGGRP